MVKRFAIVVWWLGVLWFVGAAAGFPIAFATANPGNELSTALTIAGAFAFCGVVCWTIVFVLAGTFRRPPAIE